MKCGMQMEVIFWIDIIMNKERFDEIESHFTGLFGDNSKTFWTKFIKI